MELMDSAGLAREAYLELIQVFGMRPHGRLTQLQQGVWVLMHAKKGLLRLNEEAAVEVMLKDSLRWMTEVLRYGISTDGLESDRPEDLLHRVRDAARSLLD